MVFPVALAVLIVSASLAFPAFRTPSNFRNILVFGSVTFIVAAGQTIALLTRNVDLSVGSMVALGGVVFAKVFVADLPLPFAILIALATGAGLGMIVNGLLITKAKISFLIVTLGTLAIFRSLANVLLQGRSVIVDNDFLGFISNGRLGPVPVVILIAGAVYVLALVLLRGTTFGRSVYAIGANPEAARLSGIPVDRVMIIVFGITGLLAAGAGVLTVGQIGSAQPTAGTGLELATIAAVLLGGTRFSGGYGGITNTLLGVVFLQTLVNVLLVAGVDAFWIGTVSGTVLILSVAFDRTRKD